MDVWVVLDIAGGVPQRAGAYSSRENANDRAGTWISLRRPIGMRFDPEQGRLVNSAGAPWGGDDQLCVIGPVEVDGEPVPVRAAPASGSR